jgi:hypothetical protein
VWEQRVQPQILQVAPFVPHPDIADDVAALEEEMQRVQQTLIAVRGNCYWDINNLLTRRVDAMPAGASGAPAQLRDPAAALPAVRSVAEMLKVMPPFFWGGGGASRIHEEMRAPRHSGCMRAWSTP